MTFGGSPTRVAEPPIFAISTSVMISGAASIFNILQSSYVRVAKKSMTVMLSMKPASSHVTIGKKIKILFGEYLSHLAMTRAKYVKKPALDRAVTMINIPKRSPMVSQLTKPIDSLRVNILNMSRRRAPMKCNNCSVYLFSYYSHICKNKNYKRYYGVVQCLLLFYFKAKNKNQKKILSPKK